MKHRNFRVQKTRVKKAKSSLLKEQQNTQLVLLAAMGKVKACNAASTSEMTAHP